MARKTSSSKSAKGKAKDADSKPDVDADDLHDAVEEEVVEEGSGEDTRLGNTDDEIEDAVVLDEPGDETTDAPDAADTGEDTVGAAVPEEDEADTEQEDGSAEEEPVRRVDESQTAPAAIVPPEPVIVRKGGFFPMLLGGIVAAGIGAGAALYLFPNGWSGGDAEALGQINATLEDHDKALEGLADAMPDAPDLGPLESGVAAAQGAAEAVNARVDALEARLDSIEKRPITEGASPEAVAAYERELKALQDAMAAQRGEIEKMLEDARASEAEAEMSAQEAMQRAALSRIMTAIDTGDDFSDAAANLAAAGVEVPTVLTDTAETGVPTIAALSASFPESARAALKQARKDTSGGGLGAFLDRQLGTRSLEPREGDDADAVLSRVEAAVKEGRLTDAIAELDALPEGARAQMQTWLAQAQTRADAQAAAEALAAEINKN